MHEMTYLNPNLTIIFEDLRGAEPEHIVYHEPDGILGFIRELNAKKESVHEPVYFKGEADGIEVEVAFQYVKMSSMKIFLDSVTTFITVRAVHI